MSNALIYEKNKGFLHIPLSTSSTCRVSLVGGSLVVAQFKEICRSSIYDLHHCKKYSEYVRLGYARL